MVNILAQHGIEQLDEVDSVKIFVGGLPQHPEPPLNYQIVYSLEGVLDYYTTLSWVVRDGKREQVKALSRARAGAFRRTGRRARGVSHRGRTLDDGVPLRGEDPDDGVQDASLSRPREDHGSDPRARSARPRADRREGNEVVPRDVAVAAMGPRLTKPKGPDLVALRVVVQGTKDGAAKKVGCELVDRYDEEHGISAMMRTTGYSLAITGQMQARGEISPAACTRRTSAFRRRGTSRSWGSAGWRSRRSSAGRRRAGARPYETTWHL